VTDPRSPAHTRATTALDGSQTSKLYQGLGFATQTEIKGEND